jgi:hypothetical protein
VDSAELEKMNTPSTRAVDNATASDVVEDE